MSSLRFVADENLNERLVLALERRVPGISVLRVRDAGRGGAPDEQLLEWAAAEGRVLISHDARTLPRAAFDRIESGLSMPGVLVVPLDAHTRDVLEDLEVVAGASTAEDWRDRVVFLPL